MECGGRQGREGGGGSNVGEKVTRGKFTGVVLEL